ncbi:hypothetical protein ACH5RR_029746 [Cinchona calisaya]|uniref:Uncharacterized protein n=1 Tax=Cinchona calisaya TaxID=153742 RepID=A0ABD2YW39_9GENT
MSFSEDEHSDIQMAKSHRILEFLQEDLALILDHESSAHKFLIYLRNPSFFFTAQSLCADIKFLISFLKRVQETSLDHRRSVAGLLFEMTSVVDQQSDAVGFHRILDDALQIIFIKIYRILPMGFLMALVGSDFMATTTASIRVIFLMALMGFSIAQIRFLITEMRFLRLVKVVLIPWEFIVVMELLMGVKEFLISPIVFSLALTGFLMVLMSFLVDQISFFKHSLKIANLVKKIKSVEEGVLDGNGHFAEGGNSSDEISWTQNANLVIEEKIVVGLDDKARELLDKLIGGSKKLEVNCITGMAGIGKTTLAYRLYDDPSVVNHFHLRAWTSVSQRYQERKLLNGILSCILNANDPIFAMSDEDMGEKLRKCLKGNKYLIVIDDIWDVEVWDDIKLYFPEDDNCSRILMTTRIEDVALKVKSNTSPPHCLRFLTQDESWDLFKQKLFPDRRLSEELIGIGKQIVANCKGLPLAIVVIVGLLAKEVRTQECWREVAKDIGSALNSGSEKFMDILALSYEHLTPSLKSCFLYVGSFPEDYEIPVNRLIRSWIAEGFIQHKVGKKVEDVAEDHLVNLINRSLLMAAKKRPDGGIKSCYMHDLLRDLCQWKAMEKKFVHPVCKCKQIGVHYLPTFSNCQYFHFYNLHFIDEGSVFNKDTLSIYTLLRTLDMRHINLNSFPTVVVKLLHLKYLALRVDRIKEYHHQYLNFGGLRPSSLMEIKGAELP